MDKESKKGLTNSERRATLQALLERTKTRKLNESAIKNVKKFGTERK